MQKLEVFERRRSFSDTYTYITIRAAECSEKEKGKIEDAYFKLVEKFNDDLNLAEIGVRADCTQLTTEIVEEPVKESIKPATVTKTNTMPKSDEYDIRIVFKTSADAAVKGIHEMIDVFRAMQK